MNKDPIIFLEHILESIQHIESFSKQLSKSQFSKDILYQSAIVRQLEIIGEAVKNLPPEFTVKYPSVEWAKIAGTRDKVIHHYFGLDVDIIWKVIQDDLPKLKQEIMRILILEHQSRAKK